jgi:hypothetical protein
MKVIEGRARSQACSDGLQKFMEDAVPSLARESQRS